MSTRRLCLNVTLNATEGRTLRRQLFSTSDGGYLELWVDSQQRVHEVSLSPAGMDAPPPEPLPPNREAQLELSNLLRMPRAVDESAGGATRSWRGLLLPSTVVLETIPPLWGVPVVEWWSEAGTPVLRLSTADSDLRAEFFVRRVTAWKGRKFVLLELPGGLLPPDEVGNLVLVEVLDRGMLRTLPYGDFLRSLAGMEALPGDTSLLEQAAELLGPACGHFVTERPRREAHPQEERREGTRYCVECGVSLHPGDLFCAECGTRAAAPPCPACRQPVVTLPPCGAAGGGQGKGRPWHIGWNARCEQCGHHFAAVQRVGQPHPDAASEIDHPADVGNESLLRISGAESVRVEGELWEYQPLIQVRARRLLSGETASASGELRAEDQVSLTVAECRALLDQLHGPLSVLMERESWLQTARDPRD